MLSKAFLVILALCCCSLNLHAQDLPDADTICKKEKPCANDLIAPAALITASALVSIDYQHGINRQVHRWTKDNRHHCHIDNYTRFLPSAAYLAIGELGIGAKHPLRERLAVFATSHAVMFITGYGLKGIVSEQRPDSSDHHSFPSGHVALAFTGAELLRAEYGTACGVAGYAVASSVAVMRLYNNRHWLGDVLAGAAIGILSARIGYWLLPCEKRFFGWSENKHQALVSAFPAYDVQRRALGLALVARF